MRILLALPLALLVGCQAPAVKPDLSDRYTQLTPLPKLEATPVELPQTPKLSIVTTTDGKRVAAFDKEGVDQLSAYRTAAEQNTEALRLLTVAHNGLVDQRNLTLETLRLEESRANFYATKYAETETQRMRQYDEFQTELTIHKAVILMLGVFLVL